MPSASDGWRATTDHARVRKWADDHDATPVRIEDRDGDAHLDVVPRPGSDRSERVTWDQFFEVFEAEDYAFRYRPADYGSDRPDCELVDRTGAVDLDATGGAGEAEPDAEHFATSDTGEAEPVVTDRVESGEPGDATAEGEPGDGAPAGAATDETDVPLVLDELYEDPGGLSSSPSGEYVVFANEGAERLDLSGWRVENEAGRSYEFPEGTVLEPDERLTVRGEAGDDGEHELHWGADEPVWSDRGGTVIVRAADGRQVLREPYKG